MAPFIAFSFSVWDRKGTIFFAALQEKRQIFFIKSSYLTFADDKPYPLGLNAPLEADGKRGHEVGPEVGDELDVQLGVELGV